MERRRTKESNIKVPADWGHRDSNPRDSVEGLDETERLVYEEELEVNPKVGLPDGVAFDDAEVSDEAWMGAERNRPFRKG